MTPAKVQSLTKIFYLYTQAKLNISVPEKDKRYVYPHIDVYSAYMDSVYPVFLVWL